MQQAYQATMTKKSFFKRSDVIMEFNKGFNVTCASVSQEINLH